MARLGTYAAAIALSSILSINAGAQPGQSPSEVAHALGEALVRDDHQTAATYLTSATRPLFLEMRQQEAALQEARKNLNAALVKQFRLAEGADPLHLNLPRASVTAVEIAAQRPAGPSAFELDVKLYATTRATPAHTTVWRAIEENGAWRIELPSCTPAAAPILRKRLQTVVQATQQMSVEIGAGRYADLAQARVGLAATMRTAIERSRQ